MGLFYLRKSKLNLKLPEIIQLPKWYSKKQFISDLLNLFSFKGKKYFRKLGDVKKILEKKGFHVSTKELMRYIKFYKSFQKTQLYKDIMGTFRKPRERVEYFLWLLQNLKPSKGLAGIEIPFLKTAETDEFGILAGTGHYDLQKIQELIKLKKALARVSVMFKWAGQKIIKREIVDIPEDDVDFEPITSISDVLKVTIDQHYRYDDDLFYLKLAKKELLKPVWIKYHKIPLKIVILIDVSGSMNECDKYIYANASIIALLRHAQGINEVTIVPFDDYVHNPLKFSNVKEAINHIMDNLLYSGGGTNIDRALQYADDELKANIIVLITDGLDKVQYKPKATLKTIFCYTENQEKNEYLEKISDEYIILECEPL